MSLTGPGYPMTDPLVAGGHDMVASWFGVRPAAVSNWLARYDDYPAPDVMIVHPGGYQAFGWRLERRPEWEAWRARRGKPPARAGHTGALASATDRAEGLA